MVSRASLLFAIPVLGWSLVAVAQAPKDDDRPVVPATTAPASRLNPDLPTLFLVGDSTLNSPAPLRGWAQEMAPYFDASKINVANRARGGRSARTYFAEGLWGKVLGEMKKGDVVLIQFGHNDAGRYDDPAAKFRPSLRGVGEETAEVTKPGGTRETVYTFGHYLRQYVRDAQAKGATVVLCSMVPHKDWKDGRVATPEHATFGEWTREVAEETHSPFLDLNRIIAIKYDELGPEKVAPLFADRRTHTSPEGAKLNARCVVSGLKSLPEDPLAPYFSKLAEAVPTTAPVVP